MAALMVATAAYPGLGSNAALPDMNTTDPFEAFRASQASMVKRRAPFSLSAMPSSHCASVIWNKSICGTAPAMLSSASILPKRSRVPSMMLLADCGCRRSRAEAVASAPRDIISVAVVSRLSLSLATSTMAEKSRQPESCGAAYALTCAGDDGERFCIVHVPASSNKKLRVRLGKKLRREGLTCRFQD